MMTTAVCMSGSVAEWSKALVLGTSHFDGVGSNPTTANKPFFPFIFIVFLCVIKLTFPTKLILILGVVALFFKCHYCVCSLGCLFEL